MTTRERFGKYLILDHLVDGGMAKICRARFLSDQADKMVAIKMVQPKFSQDDAFKRMFMDEIKTSFSLIHPNIVQTYDYGMNNGQLYVAMEYCDGRNLKDYLQKLQSKKFIFPVEISIYIITQVCQGLHYAHTLTDKLTGKSIKVIHRDISPHNIMLTYDGAIKIIDFGIAKSETNSENTQTGTIKGKISYLAPEYLEGEELDHRYDQFAVGITLWEMLCSRKLFKAANDLAVLKKIQECKIPPPSSINPKVTKELDEIVLKALSKNRNKRFSDLEKMNRALIKYLYANYPDFNSSDLSYFAKELFKEEIKEDSKKLYEYGNIDLAPYLADLKNEKKGLPQQEKPSVGQISEKNIVEKAGKGNGTVRETVLDFGYEKKPKGLLKTLKNVVENEKKRTRPQHSSEKPPNTNSLHLEKSKEKKSQTQKMREIRHVRKNEERSNKTSTLVKLKGEMQNRNISLGLGILILILVVAYLFESDSPIVKEFLNFTNPGEVNTRKVANGSDNSKKKIEKKIGYIQLRNFDGNKNFVYLNDVKVFPDLLGILEVEAEKNFYLRVERRNARHFIVEINLDVGEKKEIEIPGPTYMAYGYLVTSRNCVNGTLYIDIFEEKREIPLPIRGEKGIRLPVNVDNKEVASVKEYEAYYIKKNEDIQRSVKFSITENQEVDFCNFYK